MAGERLWEPDCSFGPNTNVVGAVLPGGLNWDEFDTVKVEIGVSVGCPGLNRKAIIWRHYPGVQNIVLVRLSPALRFRQDRLEQRVNDEFPVTDAHIDIVRETVLKFDTHLLLGLSTGADLPTNFTIQ